MSVTRSFFWLIAVLAFAWLALGVTLYVFQERAIYLADSQHIAVNPDWPIEEITIDAPDGEKLVAWHMSADVGCPTMLVLHGNAGHVGKAASQYSRIHKAGLGMLALSWRGYAGSTGRPAPEGLYMDAQASYEALRAFRVAPQDIIVHGFSLGASPATKVAAENEVAALILEAPFYSALRLAQEQIPIYPMSLMLRHRYPTHQYIPAVDAPILVVHGDADKTIPPSHSEDLAALAQAPVERIIFEGSSHNTLVRDGLYENVVWPFLKPHYPNCPFTVSNEVTSL